MATQSEEKLVPSLLDRLIDLEPDEDFEAPASRSQTLDKVIDGVMGDLEALLNTRREALGEVPRELKRVNASLTTYGLPDFVSLDPTSRSDRGRVQSAIAEAIAHHEPRLERVSVVPEAKGRDLVFRVEGWLQVDPSPELVVFDAVLESETEQYHVKDRR